MKSLSKILLGLILIMLWTDTANAQINLQRRYRHRKHKNIYLQDNSNSVDGGSDMKIAAGFYGTVINLMPLNTVDGSNDLIPNPIFGGTFKGSFHFSPKSYFDIGFGYMAPSSKNMDIGGIKVENTLSGLELMFLGGYDIIGSIENDFSLGLLFGGTLMFVDDKFSFGDTSSTQSVQQYYLNAGISTGIKAGPGQIKVDVIYGHPANTVNGEAVEIQFNAAYVKLNLGYKISF